MQPASPVVGPVDSLIVSAAKALEEAVYWRDESSLSWAQYSGSFDRLRKAAGLAVLSFSEKADLLERYKRARVMMREWALYSRNRWALVPVGHASYYVE